MDRRSSPCPSSSLPYRFRTCQASPNHHISQFLITNLNTYLLSVLFRWLNPGWYSNWLKVGVKETTSVLKILPKALDTRFLPHPMPKSIKISLLCSCLFWRRQHSRLGWQLYRADHGSSALSTLTYGSRSWVEFFFVVLFCSSYI